MLALFSDHLRTIHTSAFNVILVLKERDFGATSKSCHEFKPTWLGQKLVVFTSLNSLS